MADANFYDETRGVANRGGKPRPERKISEDSLRTKIILRILMYSCFIAMIGMSLTKYAGDGYSIYFATISFLAVAIFDVIHSLNRVGFWKKWYHRLLKS